MSWREGAREPVARAIAEEIDHLPFGEPGETCRAQARESYLRDADAILDALAPVVAREVARAKAEALREAADALAGGEILDDERWFASRMGEEGEANWLDARADALASEAGGS